MRSPLRNDLLAGPAAMQGNGDFGFLLLAEPGVRGVHLLERAKKDMGREASAGVNAHVGFRRDEEQPGSGVETDIGDVSNDRVRSDKGYFPPAMRHMRCSPLSWVRAASSPRSTGRSARFLIRVTELLPLQICNGNSRKTRIVREFSRCNKISSRRMGANFRATDGARGVHLPIPAPRATHSAPVRLLLSQRRHATQPATLSALRGGTGARAIRVRAVGRARLSDGCSWREDSEARASFIPNVIAKIPGQGRAT